MVESVLKYQELNDSNVVEVIYRILNATSIDSVDQEFTKSSSSPFILEGVRYNPCAIIDFSVGRDDDYSVRTPRSEIKRLYDYFGGSDVFWRGMGNVLDDLIEGKGTFEQPYSITEFFEALYDIPTEERTPTNDISDKLKTLVEEGHFKEVEACHCRASEPNVGKKSVDIHYFLVRSLAVRQQGIGASYWIGKLNEDSEYFTSNFMGLAYLSIELAEKYLEDNKERIKAGDIKGVDLFSIESTLRGVKRKLRKS